MLWLIRHGESVSNAGGVVAAYDEMDLTARGRAEAEQIAAAIAEPPRRVVLSPYRRARQTAEPLLRRYPSVPIVEAAVQEFTYLAPTRCQGTTLATRMPLVEEYWSRMDPSHRDDESAESFAEFAGRVTAFLDQAAGYDGWTMVFTHAQFMRGVALAVLLGGLTPTVEVMRTFAALRYTLDVPNGSVLRLERRDGRWWFGGIGAVGG